MKKLFAIVLIALAPAAGADITKIAAGTTIAVNAVEIRSTTAKAIKVWRAAKKATVKLYDYVFHGGGHVPDGRDCCDWLPSFHHRSTSMPVRFRVLISTLLVLGFYGVAVATVAMNGSYEIKGNLTIDGTCTGCSASTIAVVGTAVFSANGGTISGLVTNGVISGVVRNSTGLFTVSLSPNQSNYTAACLTNDNSAFNVTCNITGTATSPPASSFQIKTIQPGVALEDIDLIMVTVFK